MFTRELGSLTAILEKLNAHVRQATTAQAEERLESIHTPIHDCEVLLVSLTASFRSCNVQDPSSRRENFSKWLKMQFKGKSMEDAYKHLQSQKATLNIGLSFITLRDGSMTQDKLDELKSDIDSYQADLNDSLHDLTVRIVSTSQEARQDLEAYKRELEAAQLLLKEAARVAATTRPAAMVIEENLVDQGSRQLLGTDAENAQYDLTARGNESRGQSVQMIGNYTPGSINTVLGSMSASAIHNLPERAAGTAAPEIALRILGLTTSGRGHGPPPVRAIERSERTAATVHIAPTVDQVVAGSGVRNTGALGADWVARTTPGLP
ncbi:hypothetical protein LTR97_004318 [Elasticomyces elasticus]|uniref:Azaphilone pigments biosynthesis cluster protein L N-terminal domain-containing protein n=1 Tax=Elasticomyces elasticus TaxID=574655 RepID=A0AAN7ZUC0_9PEZI|nr:hypothetical protein LTR97_004318 [Elasticomyces elasticus]